MANSANRTPIWPAIIVLLLTAAIPVVIVAINSGFNPFVDASPTEEPKELVVSNISGNTATVTFLTPSAPTDAIIKYGTVQNSLDLIVSDTRDLESGQSQNYTVHTFDFVNLNPATTYYFKPVIGGEEYDNNGQPYQLITFNDSSSPATPRPIFGGTEPAEAGAVVYTHAIKDGVNSTVASSITAPNGTFTLDKGNLKDPATGERFDLSDAQILTFISTPSGRKGAEIYDSESNPGTINVVENYAIAEYSPDLETVPSQVTPTATTTTSPTTTITTTPSATVTISATPSPTQIPDSDIVNELLFDTYSSGKEQTDPWAPYEIFVSNLSTESFTVNWLTNKPTTGEIKLLSSNIVFLDQRDSSQTNREKRYTHSVNIDVSSLSNSNKIEFQIISNDRVYLHESGNFEMAPADLTSSPPTPESKQGSIEAEFNPRNDRDFLIYARKESSGDISTWKSAVVSEGNWNLAIGDVYEEGLADYFSSSGGSLLLNIRGEYNSRGSLTSDFDTIGNVSLEKGLSILSLNHEQTVAQVTNISGTAAPNSQVSINLNGTVNLVNSNSQGDWQLASPQGIQAGPNQIRAAAGGRVMGLSFEFRVGDLPVTAIEDHVGLIIGVLLVGAGLFLRYSKDKHNFS